MSEWGYALRGIGRFIRAGLTGKWQECKRIADEMARSANGEVHDEQRRWYKACSLIGLGNLMAMWLAGDLQTRPGYYGSTDLDTPELTALCIDLCRAGFVTTDSQRAVLAVNRDDNAVRSRATVSGFCDDATVARIHAAARETGVSVIAQRGWHSGVNSAVVVTEVDGEPYYLAGGYPGHDDLIAGWADIWHREETPGLRLGINRYAFRAVQSAWYVSVIDPEWGRNDRLISTLTSMADGTWRDRRWTP